jgi:predicted  nucleic acid-binding Zn-ribbon protein
MPTKITLDELAVMVQNGFRAVDKRFDAVETRLDRIETRLDRIENIIVVHTDQLDDLRPRVAQLEKISN